MSEDLEKAENNLKVGDRLLVLEYKTQTVEKNIDGLKEDISKIMTNHLHSCFNNGMASNNPELKEQLIQELISVLKLSK